MCLREKGQLLLVDMSIVELATEVYSRHAAIE